MKKLFFSLFFLVSGALLFGSVCPWVCVWLPAGPWRCEERVGTHAFNCVAGPNGCVLQQCPYSLALNDPLALDKLIAIPADVLADHLGGTLSTIVGQIASLYDRPADQGMIIVEGSGGVTVADKPYWFTYSVGPSESSQVWEIAVRQFGTLSLRVTSNDQAIYVISELRKDDGSVEKQAFYFQSAAKVKLASLQ